MEMSVRQAGETSLLAQIHATDEDIVAAAAQYEAIDWGRSPVGASHPLGGDASCIFRALAWLSIEGSVHCAQLAHSLLVQLSAERTVVEEGQADRRSGALRTTVVGCRSRHLNLDGHWEGGGIRSTQKPDP